MELAGKKFALTLIVVFSIIFCLFLFDIAKADDNTNEQATQATQKYTTGIDDTGLQLIDDTTGLPASESDYQVMVDRTNPNLYKLFIGKETATTHDFRIKGNSTNCQIYVAHVKGKITFDNVTIDLSELPGCEEAKPWCINFSAEPSEYHFTGQNNLTSHEGNVCIESIGGVKITGDEDGSTFLNCTSKSNKLGATIRFLNGDNNVEFSNININASTDVEYKPTLTVAAISSPSTSIVFSNCKLSVSSCFYGIASGKNITFQNSEFVGTGILSIKQIDIKNSKFNITSAYTSGLSTYGTLNIVSSDVTVDTSKTRFPAIESIDGFGIHGGLTNLINIDQSNVYATCNTFPIQSHTTHTDRIDYMNINMSNIINMCGSTEKGETKESIVLPLAIKKGPLTSTYAAAYLGFSDEEANTNEVAPKTIFIKGIKDPSPVVPPAPDTPQNSSISAQTSDASGVFAMMLIAITALSGLALLKFRNS